MHTVTDTQSPLYMAFSSLRDHLNTAILGQQSLVNRLLIVLLADGHLLVEGAPGLAKTRAINTLAKAIDAHFHRIQFTPDLLPADLTGTDIFRPQDGAFIFQQGPLFHEVLLADEINRAPAKVQSALLEAMAERQITIGAKTYPLPKLFLVMATQNPIEHEGTYPLPEAQLDRFLMMTRVDYPTAAVEHEILTLARQEALFGTFTHAPFTPMTQQTLFDARRAVLNVHTSDALEKYIVQLIMATRNPAPYQPTLTKFIQFGASPRGTLALDRCAKAHAWLANRDFVVPEDIQAVVYDVLRHRIVLSYEADAEGISADDVILNLVRAVPVP